LVSQLLNRIRQYAVFFALTLLALIFSVVLQYFPGAYFHKFFGDANPFLVFVLLSGFGAAALWSLQTGYGFEVFRGRATLRGIALSAVFATALGVAIVIADVVIRYPQDTNVPIPQALLFYPAIGFVAEIVFHLVPLAILLLVLKPLVRRLGRERVIWIGMLLVAASEPTFQVIFGGDAFTWGDAYTWIHIFIISILQLYVFLHFDFVAMYVFRMIYYLHWHILWGMARLDLLF
jgi:hypothetical protein